MADLLQDIFKNRKASPEKLLLFGFEEKDGRILPFMNPILSIWWTVRPEAL